MLEDLVRECIGTVFPGEIVLSAAVFRVTRNGDIAVPGGGRPGPGG